MSHLSSLRKLCACLTCAAYFFVASATLSLAQEGASLPKLEFRKWSGDINVPDPVALSVDDSGRVFVTQTRRRKIQDLDIRQHRHWIPSDLGLRSVDDKSNFFKSVLAIGGDQQTQSSEVQDLNQDGEHDWRDLTVVSEIIYRLTDEDGNGTADTINVFSEDFKTEVTGIAAGVMAYDGDVYATVAPDLWKLGDENEDGIADSKRSLAYGFGLHIAYAGHDMHGLTIGPDGKIYWSIGDKGINVTTSEGKNYSFPDQGGVMRCNPDGSDFEVFAHGLRNVQELAFDQYGNLFGVDNDADQPNEKERFVYIVNQMDAGWRCYYQYRKDNYNPWTAENLWNIPGENHPAYITPPIRHFIDGPAGFKFNPGTALSPEFKDYFFLTGAPNGGQYAFQVKRNGDSFQMVNDQQIGSGIAIVGLAFGPDGALYGADWDGGYPLDEKGAVVKIDVPPSLHSTARTEVQELLPKDFGGFPATDLIRLLGHQDMRVRLKAQFALVAKSRGDLLSAEARNSSATQLAKLHSIWGLGQLARLGESLARDTLVLAFKDDDPIVRGQAAKTFGEIKLANGTPLLKLLKDTDAYVRTLAALALARHPLESATQTLLEQAANLESNQYYLRHGLACALAACGSAKELAEAKENTQQQLVCVLALRKKRSELITRFLDHTDIQIATAAARAIHDDESIAAALPALADCLNTTKHLNTAFLRRAINANYRLGNEESAKRLAQFAMAQRHSIELRREALVCLFSWDTPPVLDRVEGIHRPMSTPRAAWDKNKNLQTLLAQADTEFRGEIIEAALNVRISLPIQTLAEMVSDESLSDQIRVSALQELHQQVESLVATAADGPSEALRIAALKLQSSSSGEESVKRLMAILDGKHSQREKQSAINLLADNDSEAAASAILRLGRQLIDGRIEEELRLEIYGGLLKQAEPPFEKLVAEIDAGAQTPLKGEFAKFRFSLAGGDVQEGKKIFETNIQAQCSRCHRIGETGSNIGPELTLIGKQRSPQQLLNSIVRPSHEIEAKYRTQLLLLASGQVLKGAIQSQDDDTTKLADSQGNIQDIPTGEIESIKQQEVSLMPEMQEILSPQQVRDLVAFLSSLNTTDDNRNN